MYCGRNLNYVLIACCLVIIALFSIAWSKLAILSRKVLLYHVLITSFVFVVNIANTFWRLEDNSQYTETYFGSDTYIVKISKIDYKNVQNQQLKAYGYGKILDANKHKKLIGKKIYFNICSPTEKYFKSQSLKLYCKVRYLNPHKSESFFNYLCRKEIYLYGFQGKILSIEEDGSWIYKYAHKISEKIHENIRKYSQKFGNIQSDSILYGLLLSEKKFLSQEQKDVFHVTSAAHLLAVSGLHIGFIAYALDLILRCCFLTKFRRIVILMFLVVYIVTIGHPPSAVRAYIMLSCYWISFFVDRQSSVASALLLSALIQLHWNPFILWDIGFQLSYGVVCMLLLLASVMTQFTNNLISTANNKKYTFIKKIYYKAVNFLSVSFVSTLASAPLTFEYFGLWSAIGILVNPIVIQIATMSIVCGFLFCITSLVDCLSSLSNCLFYISSRSITGIDTILRFCKDNLPWYQEYSLKCNYLGLSLFLIFLISAYVLKVIYSAKRKTRYHKSIDV